MADNIVISAIARVIDEASAPLKAIQNVITGVSDAAKQTGGFFSDLGSKISGGANAMLGGLKSIAGGVSGAVNALGSLFGPLQGLTGALGATGMTKAVMDFADSARELTATARQLGVTTDALQQFRFAAGSADVADTALQRLRQTLVTLNRGGKATESTVELLGKMGVNAQMIRDGRLEEILPLVAKAFEANVDPQRQAEAAMTLFGKQWREVLPFLQRGTAALADGAEKFRLYGNSAAEVAAGAEAAKAIRDLGQAVANARDQIAIGLLPAFTPLVQGIAEFVRNNSELLKQVALPVFLGSLATALGTLGVAIAGALGPWGLLAAAIIAAAAAIYQNWQPAMEWIDRNTGGLIANIRETASAISDYFTTAWNNIGEGFRTGGVLGGLEAMFDEYKRYWTTLLTWQADKARELGQSLADAIKSIDWNEVGRGIGQFIGTAIMQAVRAAANLGDWLAGIEWAQLGRDAGRMFVDALIIALRATVDFDRWTAEMGQKLGDAIRNVDWLGVINEIAKFFVELQLRMIQIGADLIKGLISGMIDAIPGLRDVTNRIENTFRGLGSSIRGAGDWVRGLNPLARGDGAPPVPLAANSNTPPNLLQAAGGTQRSEVTTNINLSGVPAGMSATATHSQSGAPVDTSVEVGRASFASGVG